MMFPSGTVIPAGFWEWFPRDSYTLFPRPATRLPPSPLFCPVSRATLSDRMPSAAPRFDPARRRAVTVALLLVSALASFESTVVSTAMPTIIGDLGGLPLYAWVFAVYLLTSTVTMPLYGRLADIHGRRRLILVAIGVFLTGAIVCALARSMPQLIAARAIQGLGAAGLIPVALTVIADLYSLQERARIQGLFSGAWGF